MNASTREARPGDNEGVAELWTEAYCGPGPGERATPYVPADVEEATAAGRLLVARDIGIEAIVLWSRPHQHAAHRLYESLGFHRVPERDGSDGGGPKLVFRLRFGDDE